MTPHPNPCGWVLPAILAGAAFWILASLAIGALLP